MNVTILQVVLEVIGLGVHDFQVTQVMRCFFQLKNSLLQRPPVVVLQKLSDAVWDFPL